MIKKLFLLLPLTAMFIGCTSNQEGAECPVLYVEGGQIKGVVAETPGVFAYKGIPYAAAPIGDLRLAVMPQSGAMEMRLHIVRTVFI